MISFTEARSIVKKASEKLVLEMEVLSLEKCVGRVCAVDVASKLNIQPFDNSAMDGYAVRIEDLQNACQSAPQTLKMTQVVAAGSKAPPEAVESGTCAHVMTGAPIPEGADAVVPVEQVEVKNGNVIFTSLPQHHANIRFAGEDIQKGSKLLKAGTSITPRHIMPLATAGIAQVTVHKKPRVLFLATGDELVSDLSQPLGHGQIYNSNMHYAVARLEEMGAEVAALILKDTAESFQQVLEENLAQTDVVVSSGGVSAGKFDFVRPALEALGAEILYHKVKMKPGKPNLLARLPANKLYFGLPGNPVATAVGLDVFVGVALDVVQGRTSPKEQKVRLTKAVENKKDFTLFLKGKTYVTDQATFEVDVLDGQASFMVKKFTAMNCWIYIPEGESFSAGDMVSAYHF